MTAKIIHGSRPGGRFSTIPFLECHFFIIESFMEEYMPLPAKQFEEKWQFPNCVGAIDGKHVPLINPFNSGSIKSFSVCTACIG